MVSPDITMDCDLPVPTNLVVSEPLVNSLKRTCVSKESENTKCFRTRSIMDHQIESTISDNGKGLLKVTA